MIERAGNEFVLTPLGEVAAREVAEFQSTMETAWELAPILRATASHDVDVDIEAFAGATVTAAAPGNPYRPVNRFMSLVERTETLRGLDPAAINPLHVDELYERISTGMETEAVYPSTVVEELLTANPDRSLTVIESGNLTVWIHDDLPFGLTLCDDRIGVGVYDDETGLLRTYVDTESPAAREWAEDVYTTYRSEATPLTEAFDLSRLSSDSAESGR
ncbi:helix-turn-helix transcriptional regulator [Haloterrigena alkaliphila]|uniref:MarR family transcriptional regulator n=1 Tax=Haloterrigena alkaliphila TaxID=2816475 RepID=A0A8A2VPR1_9EURY|nr:MarR family transcriptional regulator [Haloterrigena alkaliphila]QSX00099.1 MarR family transcriptional regulator [Haloterrigena alkaliphila]